MSSIFADFQQLYWGQLANKIRTYGVAEPKVFN